MASSSFYSLNDVCPGCKYSHVSLMMNMYELIDMATLGDHLMVINEDAFGLRAYGSTCSCLFCTCCLTAASLFQAEYGFKIMSCPRCDGDISMAIEYNLKRKDRTGYICAKNNWIFETKIPKKRNKKKKGARLLPPDPPLDRPCAREQEERKE